MDDCGNEMHLGIDDESGNWVAFCKDCDTIYKLTTLVLDPEAIKQIKLAYVQLETGKSFSYMVKLEKS
jgi:hypothetical protein